MADLASVPVGGDTVAVGWLEHDAEMPRRIATTESFLIGELLARAATRGRSETSNGGQPRLLPPPQPLDPLLAECRHVNERPFVFDQSEQLQSFHVGWIMDA